MKRSVKSKAGSSFIYGIKNAKEIENYHTNIKIINEWSYFEDSDIRPKILYYLKNCKFMTRSQWTVIASINYN